MNSREEILANIRRNTRVTHAMPDLTQMEEKAIVYVDPVEQFCNVCKAVGAEAVLLPEGESLQHCVRRYIGTFSRVASNLPEISCATYNPDEEATPAELDGTDVAIIRGNLGVAENGAVWISQNVSHRALYFISERLIILLDRHNLVSNMHQAYGYIDTGKYGYGVFISGPSKTADIEQALVMGAHGAKDVTVILD